MNATGKLTQLKIRERIWRGENEGVWNKKEANAVKKQGEDLEKMKMNGTEGQTLWARGIKLVTLLIVAIKAI